ncbi:hypothetical protein VP137E351_P0062 [Vibrio phage 137E35-1]|nr:hypothetical protein VP137E351_P0062 [Vibrio phage 137E35-1]CAH9016580.1 hypothetical protein VP230E391_P0062 [Vibrio phage 230E39-1]
MLSHIKTKPIKGINRSNKMKALSILAALGISLLGAVAVAAPARGTLEGDATFDATIYNCVEIFKEHGEHYAANKFKQLFDLSFEENAAKYGDDLYIDTAVEMTHKVRALPEIDRANNCYTMAIDAGYIKSNKAEK